MKTTVITGWSPAGYEQYGRRFLQGFNRHWPREVDLVVYGESSCAMPRGHFVELKHVPDMCEFLRRHDSPEKHGTVPAKGYERRWKPKHYASSYNFRFDACKFSRQGYIPEHAASHELDVEINPQLLCWLDGDVATHADVPPNFLESLLPMPMDVAYLGRGEKHSEIGFQLYRIYPGSTALPLLAAFQQHYVCGTVFDLPEWHSAYVWDEARRASGARCLNLTPGGHGHVWLQSPLARYTDHLKGKRKGLSASPERV